MCKAATASLAPVQLLVATSGASVIPSPSQADNPTPTSALIQAPGIGASACTDPLPESKTMLTAGAATSSSAPASVASRVASTNVTSLAEACSSAARSASLTPGPFDPRIQRDVDHFIQDFGRRCGELRALNHLQTRRIEKRRSFKAKLLNVSHAHSNKHAQASRRMRDAHGQFIGDEAIEVVLGYASGTRYHAIANHLWEELQMHTQL